MFYRAAQWRREQGAKGGIRSVRRCAWGGIWRGKNAEFLNFSVLFTDHTNAIVVIIRISLMIAGMGRQQRRFPRASNTLAPPLALHLQGGSKRVSCCTVLTAYFF